MFFQQYIPVKIFIFGINCMEKITGQTIHRKAKWCLVRFADGIYTYILMVSALSVLHLLSNSLLSCIHVWFLLCSSFFVHYGCFCARMYCSDVLPTTCRGTRR